MPDFVWAVIAGVPCLIIGILAGYFYRKNATEKRIGRAEETAARIVEEAKNRAELLSKERISEAKDEIHRLRSECDRECKERRAEVSKNEKRFIAREEQLEKKFYALDAGRITARAGEKELTGQLTAAEELSKSGWRSWNAWLPYKRGGQKRSLLRPLKNDARRDAAVLVRDIEQKAKQEGEQKARNIITLAIQRCAADHVAESTVSVVPLPNDEMKGRIIGREGRNIKALETATGVELIIDDTPEAVILSSFDPLRRDIARIALERLIVDGRIHPARIEDMVEKGAQGGGCADQGGGRIRHIRCGHSQHASELSKAAGTAEIPHQLRSECAEALPGSGSHCGAAGGRAGTGCHHCKACGAASRYRQERRPRGGGYAHSDRRGACKEIPRKPAVITASAAHHNDVEPETLEAVLVQAADAVGSPSRRAQRPAHYLKRLEKLEEIANSFGVEKCFAIQAGGDTHNHKSRTWFPRREP